MNDHSGKSWFLGFRQRPLERIRLFCFPYAGGGSVIYRQWSTKLPREVNVVPVELPGRGSRLLEPAFRNLPALIDALVGAITPLLGDDYALFGHSMGALIAFELARALRRQQLNQPRHIFVAGRRAPQIPTTDPLTYSLPLPGFTDELKKLNGTPKEVLDHPELMQVVLPALRADFELVQTYKYEADQPLGCPITVYGGTQDIKVPPEALLPWREQTNAQCKIHMLKGDHFFLRSAEFRLLTLLRQEMMEMISTTSGLLQRRREEKFLRKQQVD